MIAKSPVGARISRANRGASCSDLKRSANRYARHCANNVIRQMIALENTYVCDPYWDWDNYNPDPPRKGIVTYQDLL
jgi:hypothetical protein